MSLITEMAQHTVLIPAVVMDWLRSNGFSEDDLDNLFLAALRDRVAQSSDSYTILEALDQLDTLVAGFT